MKSATSPACAHRERVCVLVHVYARLCLCACARVCNPSDALTSVTISRPWQPVLYMLHLLKCSVYVCLVEGMPQTHSAPFAALRTYTRVRFVRDKIATL